MNRTFTLLTTLVTSMGASLVLAPLAGAQAAAARPAPAQPTPAAAPRAIDAKVALINFEQVVLASNEGQTVTLTTQKKYEPKKNQIETQAAEVDSMKKEIAALPATTPDDVRASKINAEVAREKILNRDAEDASTAYNSEWQEALSKVAQKIAGTMKSYAQQNGFTLLLDVSSQQSNVLWADTSTDISQAVVDAYNKSSGIAAPAPSAPSAGRPAAPRPAARPAGK